MLKQGARTAAGGSAHALGLRLTIGKVCDCIRAGAWNGAVAALECNLHVR